jgi:hypothetical protein
MNTGTIKYRNELKYLINFKDYLLLKARLSLFLKEDSHSKEYNIRSLYFDDMHDSSLNDKLSGINEREKYRIRIYDFSDKTIKLERKSRNGQFISKEATSISPEVLSMIISHNLNYSTFQEDKLLRAFYLKLKDDLLKPSIIVDYIREAYTYPLDNVRVTFDKELKFPLNSIDLFNRDISSRTILPPYTMILEVKFDKFLPQFIAQLLQVSSSRRISLSKYALCRESNIYQEVLEWMEL